MAYGNFKLDELVKLFDLTIRENSELFASIWTDLILPPEGLTQLQEICNQVKAAENSQCVTMKHLLQATKREFQKMGRLIGEEEFWQFAQK